MTGSQLYLAFVATSMLIALGLWFRAINRSCMKPQTPGTTQKREVAC